MGTFGGFLGEIRIATEVTRIVTVEDPFDFGVKIAVFALTPSRGPTMMV
jgi:hypothetical protein